MFFAIYPSGYLLGKDSHTPLMKRACSSVDTVARQVITTPLLATGAPDSVNFRAMGYVKFLPHSGQVASTE